MRGLKIRRVAAADVRWSLTKAGDIRGDVAFQNDVNALLARVEQIQVPWRSLSDLNPAPLTGAAIVSDTTPVPVARPAADALGSIGRLAPLVVTPRASDVPRQRARR